MVFGISVIFALALSYFYLDYKEKKDEKDRKKILKSHNTIDERLRFYYSEGWQVQHETDNTYFMVRKKQFSYFWATLWFLLYAVGLVFYIIYYMAKKDETFTFNKDVFLKNREATKSPEAELS